VKRLWWTMLAVLLSVIAMTAAYLISSNQLTYTGFPLDDAWIHQTYARQLAETGEWAYRPSQSSAGSTSPFWTILLALGYFVNVNHFIWAFGIGAFALGAIGILASGIIKQVTDRLLWILISGIALAGEWHLVWAAMSGMETILFVLFAVIVYWLVDKQRPIWWLIGLMIGLAVWIRPDGITLLGPALFVIALTSTGLKQGLKSIGTMFLAVSLALGAYSTFNYFIGGQFFPNTMSAKQAEYAVLRSLPILLRIGRLSLGLLASPGVLLVPGTLYGIWHALKTRRISWMAFALWWMGYILLYAIQLPVTYQHHRYIIPAIAIYIINGMIGSYWLISAIKNKIWERRVTFAFVIALIMLMVGFGWLGTQAYAVDVAVINTEMVETADWMNHNLAPESVVAVHDIGAVGYFTQFPIIDMAGLVTPQITPIIRDEDSLARFITENGANYLVTFPGWYPSLVESRDIIYQSACPFACEDGGEAMTIYFWQE